MRRRLCFSLLGLSVLGVLGSLAGCARSFVSFEQREAWRHEAEVTCLKSGTVKETSALVRISPIEGPGICGADFPLKVAALGESSALGFADDIRPPGSIPKVNAQPRWPVAQPSYPPADVYAPAPAPANAPVASAPLPPPSYPAPRAAPAYGNPSYATPPPDNYLRAPAQRSAPTYGASSEPMSLKPPGINDMIEADTMRSYPPDRRGGSVVNSYPPDRSAYDPSPVTRPAYNPPPPRMERPAAAQSLPLPVLGPARGTPYTGAVWPVEIKPNATLACPIVSALDQWIAGSVQPAAMRWFGQPVTEIKQISAYSCRGMNGQIGAKISEHAFGNALDIAAFTLADGRKVVVRTAWNGAPEEQGFLHDVQGDACKQFTTVLAPGSNQFHYDHIHVDLMRRVSRRNICQPAAIPGEVAAARAAQQKGYARRSDPVTTGSIEKKKPKLADKPYEDDDHNWATTAVPDEPDEPVVRKPIKVEHMRDL